MTEKKMPEIRFKGFDGEWQRRRLGQLYTERNERGNDSLPILSVSIHRGISDGELDEDTLGKHVRRSEDKSMYKHVFYGDLVFNMMRAWQGATGVAKVEGMVSPAYITAIPNEQVYPVFMDWYLRREEAIAQMNNLSYGVTDFRKRLYWDSFIRVLCCIPSVPEQTKIALFFHHLDNLIAHRQSKYDKLVIVKKSMLEKMFPRAGADVPEIRFTGFAAAWKRFKLGECFAERTDRSAQGELISVTINTGIKKFSELNRHDNSNNDKSNYKKVETGDIAYNSMRMWQGASGYSPYSGILSPAYTVLIPINETDSRFFSYMFKKPEMLHVFQLNSQGITSDNWNLKYPVLSVIEVLVPSPKEQTAIGNFFRNLDKTITLHQQELEKLKTIKKSMLDKLFV